MAVAVALWPRWVAVDQEMSALADAHVALDSVHTGWSFPGAVWSAPASLDLPKDRLIAHAKLRAYTEACPAVEPGTYCAKTGEVIPRGGFFAEGLQPPGLDGWSRAPALEPVRIGTLLGPDGEIRAHLPVAEAPPLLIAAILAAEDAEFREHHGVNITAGLRAVYANVKSGGYSQGASTLTMQMVRMLTQRREKTLGRKLLEAASAVALDQHLGKDGVLQLYLDSPYLGQMGNFSICGFKAAAWYYWGKTPDQLSMSEAATLAGILPAPGRFAPDRSPERARERRDLVLARMAEAGADITAALAEPVEASPHGLPEDRFPAYLQATRIWLEANLPLEVVYGTGLQVFTALDVVAQDRTDRLIPERLDYLEGVVGRRGKEPMQSAAVLIDATTGAMVAVYGGDLARPTDFNRATQARRQPGSAFKPLVYALAFSQAGPDGHPAFTAAHAVPNSPRSFANTNNWRPKNVMGEYTSTASLANGLAWSQNIATASLLEELGGPGPLIEFAKKIGFDTSHFPAEMGLALGQAEVTPLEMARFVATVIGGGHRADGSPVLTAIDAMGRVRYTHAQGDAVMTEEAAALTRDLMRGVLEYGTGGAARGAAGFPGYGGPAIGKTGTTDSEKDLWFIGGTPRYAGAVWLGYDQPQRMGASASDLAAPLWGWWMRGVTEGLPRDEEFGGLKLERRGICSITGKLPVGGCRVIGAPFLPGTAPKERCPAGHEPDLLGKGGLEEDPETGEMKKRYEGLWKRKAREEEEARAAEEAAGAPETP